MWLIQTHDYHSSEIIVKNKILIFSITNVQIEKDSDTKCDHFFFKLRNTVLISKHEAHK